jgi:hypothetical protein
MGFLAQDTGNGGLSQGPLHEPQDDQQVLLQPGHAHSEASIRVWVEGGEYEVVWERRNSNDGRSVAGAVEPNLPLLLKRR